MTVSPTVGVFAGVGVNVAVGVRVGLGVGVIVGVAVFVGVGVSVGPNGKPGPQLATSRPKVIKLMMKINDADRLFVFIRISPW